MYCPADDGRPAHCGKGLAYARQTHRARGANAWAGGRPAVRPAEPAAASIGPAYRAARLGLQAGAVVVMSSGDISPRPTRPGRRPCHQRDHPRRPPRPGPHSGRQPGRDRLGGNHDAADPGPGSPGFQEYFADNLANLECTRLNPPCRPDLGYDDFDLPNGWYVLVLNSNCGRAGGNTGDVQTPACGRGSAQLAWLGFAQQRRHGASTAARSAPSPSGTTSAGGPGSSPMTRQPTSSG